MKFVARLIAAGLSIIVGASAASADAPKLPARVLWAWQRAEDLSYIDPKSCGVAYLACRAVLDGDRIVEEWRNQPLKVPPGTVLEPVLRVDISKRSRRDSGRGKPRPYGVVRIIEKLARLPGTAQVQIDFDARVTDREFYKQVLDEIHEKLPSTKISITALTSWCLFDDWIRDLPVVETVPMLFSLGRDRAKILLYFRSKSDFHVPTCCASAGLSLEDCEINQLMIPLLKSRTIPVRFYVFTKTPWTADKYRAVQSMLGAQ